MPTPTIRWYDKSRLASIMLSDKLLLILQYAFVHQAGKGGADAELMEGELEVSSRAMSM